MVTTLGGVTRQLADTPTPVPRRSFMPFAGIARARAPRNNTTEAAAAAARP